jgi:release factor glutamine methyltransferase
LITEPDPLVARLRAAGCVYAEEEARLLRATGHQGVELEALVAARVAGSPLEPLLGWVELCGRRLVVRPGVFVPRQRTALLVRVAAQRVRARSVLVELCCGAAPVAALVPADEVHAADLCEVAAECARLNVPHGQVHVGDLYDALPPGLRGRVDVLVANAPYVPTAEIATMPLEARDHEPVRALDGGADGVDLHRRIAAGAPEWLAPGGALLIETSAGQAELTAEAMAAAGLRTSMVVDDTIGGCVLVGVWPGRPAG